MMATAALLLLALGAAGESVPGPDLLLSDGRQLVEAREELRAGDPARVDALRVLRAEADQAMARGPWSVVDKNPLPPGADPHDYRSQGPYWWPDPARPDGLPWIRRDGERNPASRTDAFDRARFGAMQEAVGTLSLAYFLTGHEPYAERAAGVLRRWFLDPATRMNPHLRYAQAIPGITAGRGIGIIDTARLPAMLDRVALLGGSPSWTEADRRGLRAWVAAYLDWLRASGHGRDEEQTTNNHGSWYDVQVAAFALHARRPELARAQIQEKTRARIAAHIRADGRQPRELERTRSLSYSLFNLEALLTAALMGRRVDLDLGGATAEGKALARAADYLLPYAAEGAVWPDRQITPVSWSTFAKVLRLASLLCGDPRFSRAATAAAARGEPEASTTWLHPDLAPASK